MKWQARVRSDGGFDFGERTEQLKAWLKKNAGARLELIHLLPESRKQRKFYHGAVLPLWAYLNGHDYKDSDVLHWIHEYAKAEFNGEMVIFDGKPQKRGLSTKGKLGVYVEKVIEYLVEQYAIDQREVLDPERYKYWRDVLFPSGDTACDNYIDYLIAIKVLK